MLQDLIWLLGKGDLVIVVFGYTVLILWAVEEVDMKLSNLSLLNGRCFNL